MITKRGTYSDICRRNEMLLYTGVVTEYCMMSVAVTKVLFLCFAVGVTREGISP